MFINVFQIHDLTWYSHSNHVARAVSACPAGRGGERTGNLSDQPKVMQTAGVFCGQTRKTTRAGGGRWPMLGVDNWSSLFLVSGTSCAGCYYGRGGGGKCPQFAPAYAPAWGAMCWAIELPQHFSQTLDFGKLFATLCIPVSQGNVWSNAGVLCPKWSSWVKEKMLDSLFQVFFLAQNIDVTVRYNSADHLNNSLLLTRAFNTYSPNNSQGNGQACCYLSPLCRWGNWVPERTQR